jgi:hypothetical protein
MLRNLVMLASVLFATNALAAYPKIGDNVVFSFNNTYKIELNNNGFDSNGKVWVILQTVRNQADQIIQTKYVHWTNDQILNQPLVLDILANCAKYGGAPERVKVIAGEFDSCRLPNKDKDAYSWVADVPFGLVKSQTKDGILELMKHN